MLTKEKVLTILRKELPHITLEYNVKRIGIFGSFAKGTPREDSDVDILVEFDKPIGLKFVDFGEYLEKVLGKKIDILTPAGVKGIRVQEVAKDIEEQVIYVQ